MTTIFFDLHGCSYRDVIPIADALWRDLQRREPHLAAKIERDPESGCWVWMAASDTNGYGCMTRAGRMGKAHRFLYELFLGPIPAGLFLDHLCRRPACVNPLHLEAVTPTVNTRRAVRRVVVAECGTRAGYQQHLRRKEPACSACCAARNLYARQWAALRRPPRNVRVDCPDGCGYRTPLTTEKFAERGLALHSCTARAIGARS